MLVLLCLVRRAEEVLGRGLSSPGIANPVRFPPPRRYLPALGKDARLQRHRPKETSSMTAMP